MTRLLQQLDLSTVKGALLAVLGLRFIYGAVMLAASFIEPVHASEMAIGLVPGDASVQDWLSRIFLDPWLRRDAGYYFDIASSGYSVEAGTTAFHPLYPLLTALLAPLLFGNVLLAMVVVSTAACVALCVLFVRYVAQAYGAQHAQLAGWCLLVMPPGLVWLSLYTDGLFTAMAVAAMLSLHRKQWARAGLFGALATLTRQQGLALVIPFLYLLWKDYRRGELRASQVASLVGIPLSYAAFSAYRSWIVGDLEAISNPHDPVQWVQAFLVSHAAQEIAPGQRITWPWEPLIDQLSIFMQDTELLHMLINLGLGWAMILIVLVGLRHLTVPDRLYALTTIALALCYYNGSIEPYMALPRHIMVAFPLFVVVAIYLRDKQTRTLLLAASFLTNLGLLMLYGALRWVP